jgi:hypothetical protein
MFITTRIIQERVPPDEFFEPGWCGLLWILVKAKRHPTHWHWWLIIEMKLIWKYFCIGRKFLSVWSSLPPLEISLKICPHWKCHHGNKLRHCEKFANTVKMLMAFWGTAWKYAACAEDMVWCSSFQAWLWWTYNRDNALGKDSGVPCRNLNIILMLGRYMADRGSVFNRL